MDKWMLRMLVRKIVAVEELRQIQAFREKGWDGPAMDYLEAYYSRLRDYAENSLRFWENEFGEEG